MSKKTSFTESSIWRFATNTISISSQLAEGSPNAQFGKTQFFKHPVPVTHKPQFIRLKFESQCRNIRRELNQLSMKKYLCHDYLLAIFKKKYSQILTKDSQK